MNELVLSDIKGNLPSAPTREKSMSQGMEGGNFARISLRGGRFRPIINGEEGAPAANTYLDVVIVDWMPAVGRLFYEGGYQPGSKDAPVCISDNGETPHTSSSSPQNSTCRGCPQNAEGSGQNGRGRACGFSRRLLVMVVGMPDQLFSLDLKGLSLFKDKGHPEGWRCYRDYSKYLDSNKVDGIQVVTRMEFDDTESVPALRFKAVAPVGDNYGPAMKLHQDLDDAERERLLTFAVTQGQQTHDSKADSGTTAADPVITQAKQQAAVADKVADPEPDTTASPFGSAETVDAEPEPKQNISTGEERKDPANPEPADGDDPLAGLDEATRKQLEELGLT